MDLQEYLDSIPDQRRERFESIRALIKSLYPNARESMRYKMPTYEYQEGWVAIANQKQYISVYTCSPEHIAKFKKKHPEIKTGKGCVNFRDRNEISHEDLETVIRSAMEYRHT